MLLENKKTKLKYNLFLLICIHVYSDTGVILRIMDVNEKKNEYSHCKSKTNHAVVLILITLFIIVISIVSIIKDEGIY